MWPDKYRKDATDLHLSSLCVLEQELPRAMEHADHSIGYQRVSWIDQVSARGVAFSFSSGLAARGP